MVATVEDGTSGRAAPRTRTIRSPRGFACQKGIAFSEVVNDPDRVTVPLKRGPNGFEEVSWDEALTDIAERLTAILRRTAPVAVGWYMGNPAAFSYSHSFAAMGFIKGVGRHSHYFTASSQDTSSRLAASQFLYGGPMAVPIPRSGTYRPAGDDGRESRCLAWQLLDRAAHQGPHARHRQAWWARGGRRSTQDGDRRRSSNGSASSPTGTPIFLLSLLQVMFADGLVDRGADRIGRPTDWTGSTGSARSRRRSPPVDRRRASDRPARRRVTCRDAACRGVREVSERA